MEPRSFDAQDRLGLFALSRHAIDLGDLRLFMGSATVLRSVEPVGELGGGQFRLTDRNSEPNTGQRRHAELLSVRRQGVERRFSHAPVH